MDVCGSHSKKILELIIVNMKLICHATDQVIEHPTLKESDKLYQYVYILRHSGTDILAINLIFILS